MSGLSYEKKNILHRVKVEGCIRCPNSEQRKKHQDQYGYCTYAKTTDGLGARCVGGWGANKAVFLKYYVDITGKALKSSWENIYYIEICSGPGICVDYNEGEQFDGTALAVLQTEGAKYFSKLFFFDINPITIEILKQRIANSPNICEEVKQKVIVSVGDYKKPNSILNVLYANIPSNVRGLNVVFVDPTDLSVPFKLYDSLLNFGNTADFITNYAYGTDFQRNVVSAFKKPKSPSRKKYEGTLQELGFFEDEVNRLDAEHNNFRELAKEHKKQFLKSFEDRGYKFVITTRIKWYYELIYISKNPLGRKFWEEASKKSAREREVGQKTLSFD
ncbi:MAG: three-Cys-motif partner protein TcmP [Sphaerochaetaceae bacterium]|jgi:three-Cys-motif partner protein|nr:three-Cys-motif partner protein TcmP [Sphaerochaetaceae bacterium]MDD4219585.1 three-Cys-motif partner protein TcmP [Sphaerochaetaceae bacterium]